MSKWVDGVLDLNCSIDVLKRALASLMPQWKDHIHVDPKGNLSMYRYSGAGSDPEQRRRKDITVHVLIPGSGNPNFPTPPGRGSDNDWGFRLENGKWQLKFADFNKQSAFELANKVKGEVLRLRSLAIAQLKSYQVTSDTMKGNKRVIELAISEEKAKQIMAQLG